jgi:chromosome segregation ATPase
MDREHLYVAMTPGRHANHAYITPDPTTDDDDHHRGHPHPRHAADTAEDPQEQAARVLEAALARAGAQDAAHTALQHARTQATQTAQQHERHAARAAVREAAETERQRRQAGPLPAEHARAARQLDQLRAERERLGAERDALHRTLRQTGTELEALPRWARSRRRALTDTTTSTQQRLHQTEPAQVSLDAEIDRLSRQVAQHTRERLTGDLATHHRARKDGRDRTRTAELARPRQAPLNAHELPASMLAPHQPYRGSQRDLGDGLSR